MRATLDTLRDDTEAVILHDGAAADTTEQALLDTLVELDDGDTGRGSGNLDRDLANGHPGDTDARCMCISVSDSPPEACDDLQNGDEHRIPELLTHCQVAAAAVELAGVLIIAVVDTDVNPHDYG